MRYVIIAIVFIILLAGCQSNKENEVINEHNNFTNIERLDQFVENIKNGIEDEIDYIRYGVEGQEGRNTLTYNGNQINVTNHSDGDFIEEYDCEDLVSESNEDLTTYTLKGCTGLPRDYELVAVPK